MRDLGFCVVGARRRSHGGLSPELTQMEQVKRIMRPTDVPDTGLLCDLLWSGASRDVMRRTVPMS